MILHVPHSSRLIPDEYRDQFVLSDKDLSAELTLMTDAFTDELFELPDATMMRHPVSRLLVDPERFPDDALEPMSKVGMGRIYTLTADGRQLRRPLTADEKAELVTRYYDSHHQSFTEAVKGELEKHGRALIVDCHSFPDHPLPREMDQQVPRPDYCIGADTFHTSPPLVPAAVDCLRKMGCSTGINRPYAGTIVPMAHYNKDRRVASIMVEVNRRLYMDEKAGTKTPDFNRIKTQVHTLLSAIRGVECAI